MERRRLEEVETRENRETTTVLILPTEILCNIFSYFSPIFISHSLRLVCKNFCVTSQLNNLVKHAEFKKNEMTKCHVNIRQIPQYLSKLDNLRSLVIEGEYLLYFKTYFSICKLTKLEVLTINGYIPLLDVTCGRMMSGILTSCKNITIKSSYHHLIIERTKKSLV